MVKIIVEVSKYVLLLIMVLFTIETFMVLRFRSKEQKNRIMRKQIILMLFFNFLAYIVMYCVKQQMEMLIIYLGVVIYILLVQAMYRLVYKKASLILLNTMCMLLSIGFVIQTRLGINYAIKQLMIVAVSTAVSMLIPVIVRKARFIRQMTVAYAVVGIVLLVAVLGLSRVTGGANLSIEIGGITFQFSEFVKITFVFFIAGMLREVTDFHQVAITTVVAAMHVIILVLSKDLGAALIYFMAYVVMVYVATGKVGYAALGLGGMGVASVAAYKLFSHIRVRFSVWRDPFADYQGTGYQIVQALFGVCAGGLWGTGLFLGNPEMIPLARVDFTYAAICEEMGILFGICLILLCMGMYFLIVNISMKLKEPFYKLVAIGLGTEYCFQVFLTIGGTTKFIPMTGVTLPLVSYGGSSVMCTIIMISIVQGLYILREDEDDAIRLQRRKEARQFRRRNMPGRQEEMRRQEELRRQEEMRRQNEMLRQEEMRRQNELRRQEAMRRADAVRRSENSRP
ncbi:MAG: FtsW/RodA/SpoVE family cell cycle protein, partial [Lachnospiraceae bacterium]|nr:FtsW/RodA/SpoVE family cell cycle protein [Lachnospiraceae bacterium]